MPKKNNVEKKKQRETPALLCGGVGKCGGCGHIYTGIHLGE